MRYKIIFSYDGTNFQGFQFQKGFRTIEGELVRVVSFLNQQQATKICGSGRTDRGVHARNQVAHFDLSIDIPLYKIKMGMNSMLPDDIHVHTVQKVADNFHARYMVKEKVYQYLLNQGEYDPIARNYCYQYGHKLDIDLMNDAKDVFIGIHDFRSFVSAEDKREDAVREIYDIIINEDQDQITFTFRGNGFMKYQIRNMIGALVEVGSHKKTKEDLIRIMDLKDREKAGYMVPACGLYLTDVIY